MQGENNRNKGPSKQSLRSLDYTNFFLADVRDGIGPELSIYLRASHHWNPADIGIAVATSTITQVIVQTPVGALIDHIRQKRLLIWIATACVIIGCLGIAFFPTFPVVIGSQILIGVAGATFLPTVAAITLGLVNRRKFDRRVGRNEAFNHGGNLLAATGAGLIGQFVARKAIFLLTAAFTVGSSIAVQGIRAREVDYERSRGAAEEGKYSSFKKLLSDRRILFFAVSIVLFQLGNSAMLTLVGQVLEQDKLLPAVDPTLYMSLCIIIAQLFMLPAAYLSGRFASGGRKRVFLVGFAAVPLRGVLFTLWNNPIYLLSIQILDGVGAGIFGVMSVLMIADLTKGTGRFNVTQGLLNACIGIGNGCSNLIAGFVANQAGYNAGFLGLVGISLGALAFFWCFVPETKEQAGGEAAVT